MRYGGEVSNAFSRVETGGPSRRKSADLSHRSKVNSERPLMEDTVIPVAKQGTLIEAACRQMTTTGKYARQLGGIISNSRDGSVTSIH